MRVGSGGVAAAWAVALCCLLVAPTRVASLQFFLGMLEEKCLGDDTGKHELIHLEYSVSPFNKHANEVRVRVTDPSGKTLYEKERQQTGKFAFTTTMEGEYKVCFSNQVMTQKTIQFEFKTGVNAKDYTQVAKKNNLKPMETELRRLEDLSHAIHKDALHLKEQGEQMHEQTAATNSRVLWYSFMSMAMMLLLMGGQLVYLKMYFRRRKIID